MHVMLVGPEFEENLSLRYLAAALIAAGHKATMARFDSPEYVDGVVSRAISEQPRLIGLSMVFQVRAREFFTLARALRQAGYRGHITAGGHFATFACAEILGGVPEIDSIIRQEGEATLCELASALEQDAEWKSIPGMVARDEAGLPLAAPARQQAANLDALPFPIRDSEPERHLGVPTAFMVGSRGCYADCEYCSIFAWHEAAIGKRYRLRTVGNIADEMQQLYLDRGVRFFVFHDDNFFLPTAAANRKRFTALRAEIHARGLHDIGLMLKLRPNDCDCENMLILKEIGLMRAFVGIENASQRQLRSLGRDSTIGDVEACLSMLRELDIYATFNILLFDPYTRLEDITENIKFLRRNSYFPFNWCKVEPYAGTELLKRYEREGRLVGDFLGHDYRMDDPHVRLLYDILLPAVHYRNFDYFGLANLNIGLGYHWQLLKHFYADCAAPHVDLEVKRVIETINHSALDLIETVLGFVSKVDLQDAAGITRFAEEMKRRSFVEQAELSPHVEKAMRIIEAAAGVRIMPGAGVSEAFTPIRVGAVEPEAQETPTSARSLRALLATWLAVARPTQSKSAQADLPRRRTLLAAGGGLIWLLAGCRNSEPAARPPATSGIGLQGLVSVVPGCSDTAAEWESLSLQGDLIPDDTVVIGPPRILAAEGKIDGVQVSDGGRRVQFQFHPSGGWTMRDPNVSVAVTWLVRGKSTDTTVMARGFVHVQKDGRYAFGFETPRPTISEMAAPPIMNGPAPPK